MRTLALVLLVVARPLPAQGLVPRAIPSSDVEAFSIASPSLGNRYDIIVGTPPNYRATPGKKYAAMIVTDGNLAFPIAFDAARSLANQGDIEPMFVISVGAPFEEGDTAFVRRRVYEFSPPDWPMNDPFGVSVSTTCREYTHAPPGKCTGGAPKFLEFLVAELLPRLQEKYPIDPARLGLFGVSAGGFFAAWTIFQPRSPFTTYLIASPAMAYGGGTAFRDEAHFAASHTDLKAAVFVASGSLEMSDPYLEGVGQVVSGHARLVAALRGRHYPSLRLYSEVMKGFSHGDATGPAMLRGVRQLYGKH